MRPFTSHNHRMRFSPIREDYVYGYVCTIPEHRWTRVEVVRAYAGEWNVYVRINDAFERGRGVEGVPFATAMRIARQEVERIMVDNQQGDYEVHRVRETPTMFRTRWTWYDNVHECGVWAELDTSGFSDNGRFRWGFRHIGTVATTHDMSIDAARGRVSELSGGLDIYLPNGRSACTRL